MYGQISYNESMENSMNTKKTQLNSLHELDDFSKIEVFERYLEVKLDRDKKAVQVEELQATVNQLRELLILGQSKVYGASSEKYIVEDGEQTSLLEDGNLGVFNEAEKFVKVAKEAHVRRKKGEVGPNKPCFDHLPVEEVIEELLPEDQICDTCQGPLRVLKTVERFEIGIRPAQLYKIKRVSTIYSCPVCEENGDNPIKNSAKELPVFQGSYVSPSLLAYTLAKKYWEKVPIHRLEKKFYYSGVKISRGLISKWIIDGAHLYLRGLYDLMHEELLKGSIIQADETRLQVLKEPGRRPQQESYMWHYVSGHLEPRQISLYEYQPGRSGEYAKKFLEGFTGFLQTDGYKAYGMVPGVTRVGCHAHARRMFLDAIKAMGKDKASVRGTLAYKGLSYYNQLFALEDKFSTMSPQDRYQARLEQSKKLLEALKKWLHETQKIVVAKSKLGEAINYSINQWPYLVAFLQDANLETSTNRVLSSSLGNPHLSSGMHCRNVA